MTNRKYSIYEILFFFALTVYLFGRCLEYTVWDEQYGNFFKLLKNVSYIILFVLICIVLIEVALKSNRENRIKGLFLFALFLFFIYYAFKYKINSGFVCFSFSLCVTKIDMRKVFRYLYKYLIFLMILCIVSGINNMTTTSRAFGNTRIRYAFSFAHPYTMQLIWMSIVSCKILKDDRKQKLHELIILVVVTLVFQLIGDTRGAFIATIFLIVFDLVIKKKNDGRYIPHKREKILNLLSLCFPVLFIFVNGCCILYVISKNNFVIVLDKFFTGRISMGSRFYWGVCDSKIQLLPIDKNVNLEELSLGSYVLDSEYSQWFFVFGSIFSIIVLILLFLAMKKMINTRKWSLIAIYVTISINACVDPCILSILYNPAILMVVPMILQPNIKKQCYKGESYGSINCNNIS